MSKIIDAFNAISNEPQEKISPTNNIKLYMSFENANYDKYLNSLIEQIESDNFIDIYSLFIAMNSEIFLKIDDSDACVKILDNYVTFIKNSFEEISPIDQRQKKMFCERGIHSFLSFLHSNLDEKVNNQKENKNIDLDISMITNYLDDLLSFLLEKEIKFDDLIKKDLFKVLEKISLKQQHAKEPEEPEEPEDDNSDTKSPNNKKHKQTTTASGSYKWTQLLDKIDVLQELIKSDRIFETAIVYDDIKNKLDHFDPKEYFPEIFFPLYKSITPMARKIHVSIDHYSSTVQWQMAKKMYNIDYKSFLLDYERMPENDFIEEERAQEHFYSSSEDINKTDNDTNTEGNDFF